MDPQIVFWIFALLLLLVALAFILPPLLRKPTDVVDDRRDQNIRITREQLAELEAEYQQGGMDEDSYKVAKEELEDALYNDLEDAEDTSTDAAAQRYSKLPAILVALLIPAIAVGLYLKYGEPRAIPESSVIVSQQASHNGKGKSGKSNLSLQEMLGKLEKKLKDDPDNFTGWVMLGRSYMVMNRPDDAVKAYQKAVALNDKQPAVLLQLADALGTSQKGSLLGKPDQLIQQALKLEPDNLMGLWLAGMTARQRGDKAEAIEYWKKVLPKLKPGSEERQEVVGLIKQAGGDVTGLEAAKAPATSQQGSATAAQPIVVTIDLSDDLKARSKPEQTVFIYAKALSGPPMPLAAVRKQVKDLPLTVTLDDSLAMMPQLKLSGFKEVKVGARISLSGTPTKSKGDLYTEKSPVKPGEKIQLTIDQVVE